MRTSRCCALVAVGFLGASASAGAVRAEPALPSSCGELRDVPFAKLPVAVQNKVLGGAAWETAGYAAKFVKLDVIVSIARGPQLVRAILMACPGAIAVTEVTSYDARHFNSTVRMHVKSFATLARIVQMPSVASVSINDPTVPLPPEPSFEF